MQKWMPAFLIALAAVPGAEAVSPRLSDCALPGLAEAARCGTLAVPENPELVDGRQIDIAFAVLPATGGKALLDPLVLLNGGPGEDAIGVAADIATQLAPLRGRRDILLVDQRGTGRSHPLACRLFDPSNPGASLRDFLPTAAVEACERELARRADLSQYSYLHFARDLEAIRNALGYGKLNLFAGSYGTRAAQVFVRAYPDSVRTAYLGSVVPIDVIPPLTMAKASQDVFERTIGACAADAACRAAYPNLRSEFDAILQKLDSGAVRVRVPGGAETAALDRGRVVEWLRSQIYRPGNAASLPWLIHRAHEGDWSPIVEGILDQARGLDAEYEIGLFLSITCAEDLAFLKEAEIAPASDGTYLGDYRVRQQQAACRRWPKATLPKGYREPVRSATPAMFVSGDMDAASPFAFMSRVASGFANRVEIVSRGRGHTEWSDCLAGLYRQFVEAGATAGIDAAACPAVVRPPFRTAQADLLIRHATLVDAGHARAIPGQAVAVMAGTDAGFLNSFNYPGIGLHDELALYVEKGLTPAKALTAASRAGPAWFGRLDCYGAPRSTACRTMRGEKWLPGMRGPRDDAPRPG
jgi:pimeloyl-ACP methyl ester carboxylesterase